MQPILYESHMHTPLCKHAQGEPEAYAAMAEQRGLAGIIVTCHNPTEGNRLTPHVRMRVDQFDEYVGMVERARRAWAGRVDVRLGMESDFLPGQEAWLARLHDRAAFNHVLGSVHPQMKIYKQSYLNGDVRAFQRQYFTHLAEAAETGLFDTLSHPDLVKIVHPKEYRVEPLLDHIRGCLDRIAQTGIAMELNTSGLNKAYPEMNPGPVILAEMRARGIHVVWARMPTIPSGGGQLFGRDGSAGGRGLQADQLFPGTQTPRCGDFCGAGESAPSWF